MSKRKATPSPTRTNKKAYRDLDLNYNNTFQINEVIYIIYILIIMSIFYYFILT